MEKTMVPNNIFMQVISQLQVSVFELIHLFQSFNLFHVPL